MTNMETQRSQRAETELSLRDSNNTDDIKIKIKDPARANLVNRSHKPLLLEDSHRTLNDQSWHVPVFSGVDKSGTIDGNIFVDDNSSGIRADESRRQPQNLRSYRNS